MSNEELVLKDNNAPTVKKERESGIELLKIIAIAFIIISHVVQTLIEENTYITYSDYIIDVSTSSLNPVNIILVLLMHLGQFGNLIFFICSAWFLLNSSKYSKKKCFLMIAEVWAISILFLIATFYPLHDQLSKKIIIKSVFPTIFSNNWYITCYLLFYAIHPLLNSVINKMTKKQLLRSVFALSFLYIFCNFIRNGLFFSSNLILWTTIYFDTAFMKKYLMSFADSIKANIILLIINFVGFVLIVLLTEVLGQHISYLYDKQLHWISSANIFLILMSVALFNLFRNMHFYSKFINYISSLSLLAYIIHENIIIRTYYRPMLWNYIYNNFGYNYVIGWVFIIAISMFIGSIIISTLYSLTIKRFVDKVASKLYVLLKNTYLKFENKLVKNNEENSLS